MKMVTMPLDKKNKEQLQNILSLHIKKITANMKNVKTLSNFGEIIETYETCRDGLKDYMKIPKNLDKVRLDRHKIAAVMMASILYEEPIYTISADVKKKKITTIANIYLAMLVGINILEDFYKGGGNENISCIKPDKIYFDEFRKLMLANHKHIINIVKTNKTTKAKQGLEFLFFISHIFYWIDTKDRNNGLNHFEPEA